MQIALLLLVICSCIGGETVRRVRQTLNDLLERGRLRDVLALVIDVENSHGTLRLDEELPSLYSFKALGLADSLRMDESIAAFEESLAHHPFDSRTWISLGEMQMSCGRNVDALTSFEKALLYGYTDAAYSRILLSKGWSANWKDFDVLTAKLEVLAEKCAKHAETCPLDTHLGLDYTEAGGAALRAVGMASQIVTESSVLASISQATRSHRRLRVGFITSDLDKHPVAQLIRGMVQSVDKQRMEIFFFGLKPELSWWGVNISKNADHAFWFHEMNAIEAAERVALLGIDILVDLNGHTKFSGLPILAHRPAPIMLSFLGSPTTTATTFIDYFVGDAVATPGEHRSHFAESLLLLPSCYLVNDHAQIHGRVITDPRASVMDWLPLNANHHRLKRSAALFGTLSGEIKFDPLLFAVWTNVLRSVPTATLVHTRFANTDIVEHNLQQSLRYHGLPAESLVAVGQTHIMDHMHIKTSLDLLLDTRIKTGHSSGLDGAWAGVPTVTLAGASSSERRAGESIAVSLGAEYGLTDSLKDYEDVVVSAVKNRTKLEVWRRFVGKQRLRSELFHTQRWTSSFVSLLQTTWEASLLTPKGEKKYHIFPGKRATSYQGPPVAPFQLVDRALAELTIQA